MVYIQYYISFSCLAIWRLYTLWIDMSSNQVTICHQINIVIITVLTIFLIVYVTFPISFFNNWKFAPLNPLHLFCPDPLWQPPACCLYLWVCFVFWCAFASGVIYTEFLQSLAHVSFVYLWLCLVFSSCSEWGLLFICGVQLSRFGDFLWLLGTSSHWLSCPLACGFLVPEPGIELMSPALAGRFLTTGPSGKPCPCVFFSVPSSSWQYC